MKLEWIEMKDEMKYEVVRYLQIDRRNGNKMNWNGTKTKWSSKIQTIYSSNPLPQMTEERV